MCSCNVLYTVFCFCFLFVCFFVCFLIFDVIFSIAKGVQHDGHLPFWKPASVFAYCICIVIAFAFGEINLLLLLSQELRPRSRPSTLPSCPPNEKSWARPW